MSGWGLVGVMVLAFTCVPATARAQQAMTAGALVAHADTPPPKSILLQSLYVSTAVTQGLDAHSTLLALRHGGVEANPVVSPITSHTVAFVATKSAVAAATIFAAHKLSKGNKAGAIAVLLAANAAYALIAAHNYRVATNR